MPEKNLHYQKNARKSESLYLNIFWYGFLLYSLGGILSSTNYLGIKICQAIQALGVVLFIVGVVYLMRPNLSSGYLKRIFPLYILWLLAVVVRSDDFSFSYDFVKKFLFGGGNGGLIYLTPLILLFPGNFVYYRKLFQVVSLFSILSLCLVVILIKKLLISGQNIESQTIVENIAEISIPAGFILLTYLYHSNKRIFLAVATTGIILILTIVRARRGLIFITSSILLFSFLIYFYNTRKKFFIVYACILVLVFGAIYTSGVYRLANNKILGFLYERGKEHTRKNVELYFYADMEPTDWIAGRGISGQYFCPDIEEEQVTDFRSVIETGYLQIILKGGLVSLGLLLLITVPACIKGIFYSNNILSKAAGIWIFQFLIDLYPQNSAAFNLTYLLVWISVGICFSDKIRKMSNEEVRAELLITKKPRRPGKATRL